jgi:hypothetical protein
LLAFNADLSIKNALQKTAYECTRERRHPDIANLIKKYQEEEDRMARAEKVLGDVTKKTTRPNQESNIVKPWLLGGVSVTATAVIAGITIAACQILKRR